MALVKSKDQLWARRNGCVHATVALFAGRVRKLRKQEGAGIASARHRWLVRAAGLAVLGVLCGLVFSAGCRKSDGDTSVALSDVVKAQSRAEQAWARVQGLDRSQGFGGELDEAEAAYRSAQTFFDLQAYADALKAYEDLQDTCFNLLVMELARARAREARSNAAVAAEGAMRAGADTLAEHLWQSAAATSEAGELAFTSGQFEQAEESWRNAAAEYDNAELHIEQAALAEEAKLAYDQMIGALSGPQLAALDHHGGQAWAEAQSSISSATADGDPGQIAMCYQDAAESLPAVVEAAIEAQFDEHLTTSRSLYDSGQYGEALAAIALALELKPQDASARALQVEIVASIEPIVYTDWPFDAAEATRRQEETAATLGVAVTQELDLGGGVMMKMVLLPAGEFMMGDTVSAEQRAGELNTQADRLLDEHPMHNVRISRPFYMGIYEVTQEQYEAVMGNNPSQFTGPTLPVEQVSWDDAVAFCRQASTVTGRTFRLPTEAEWEYACRAGTSTAFCWGDDFLQGICNIENDEGSDENSNVEPFRRMGLPVDQTVPVGSFAPNVWGLHDMHGNVWEWCHDWYGEDYYADSEAVDPQGPRGGEVHVLRGGSWINPPAWGRSAKRNGYSLRSTYTGIRGFRVAVSLD